MASHARPVQNFGVRDNAPTNTSGEGNAVLYALYPAISYAPKISQSTPEQSLKSVAGFGL